MVTKLMNDAASTLPPATNVGEGTRGWAGLNCWCSLLLSCFSQQFTRFRTRPRIACRLTPASGAFDLLQLGERKRGSCCCYVAEKLLLSHIIHQNPTSAQPTTAVRSRWVTTNTLPPSETESIMGKFMAVCKELLTEGVEKCIFQTKPIRRRSRFTSM